MRSRPWSSIDSAVADDLPVAGQRRAHARRDGQAVRDVVGDGGRRRRHLPPSAARRAAAVPAAARRSARPGRGSSAPSIVSDVAAGIGQLVGPQRDVEPDADHDRRAPGVATSARMPASLRPSVAGEHVVGPLEARRHARDVGDGVDDGQTRRQRDPPPAPPRAGRRWARRPTSRSARRERPTRCGRCDRGPRSGSRPPARAGDVLAGCARGRSDRRWWNRSLATTSTAAPDRVRHREQRVDRFAASRGSRVVRPASSALIEVTLWRAAAGARRRKHRLCQNCGVTDVTRG